MTFRREGGITTPRRVLTVAGSDSGGGAGIQADLKTFLALGAHGMSAIAAVTVQNSLGVQGFYELEPPALFEQIESVVTDIGVEATKTGMLASAALIEAAADAFERFAIYPLVVDPVAASKHGDPLLRDDALDALRNRLLPLATVATPNLDEVQLLTGIEVRDRDDLERAARAVHALGPRWVLLKGGHLPGAEAVDLLWNGEHGVELATPRIDTPHTHGTGDTLAAAVTVGLARGLEVEVAVRAAKEYLVGAIAHGFALGQGIGPVDHGWQIRGAHASTSEHVSGSPLETRPRGRGSGLRHRRSASPSTADESARAGRRPAATSSQAKASSPPSTASCGRKPNSKYRTSGWWASTSTQPPRSSAIPTDERSTSSPRSSRAMSPAGSSTVPTKASSGAGSTPRKCRKDFFPTRKHGSTTGLGSQPKAVHVR